MKKILVAVLFLSFIVGSVKADYFSDSVDRFINSPSIIDLGDIENPIESFCEETYLEAYRRRDFTEIEQEICGDFFARKMEDELNYMKFVFGEREIY